METWFIFTLITLFFSGFFVFIQKIGAERGYNSSLLNSYSAGLSAVFGFILAGVVEGFSEISWTLISYAVLSGLLFILSTNFRMDALRHINTTIFFPLNKFLGPLLVLIIGITVFDEVLTTLEKIGITLGLLVPLLLITRAEGGRQNNLKLGLVLMFFSTLLGALSVAVNKGATDVFVSALLFMAFSQAFSAGFGYLLFKYRKKSVNTKPEVHHFDKNLIKLALIFSVVQLISSSAFILAFATGGDLAIVYTIHSLYIVIPIILAIIIYKEHWNFQKLVAIILSILAVWFMM